MKKLFFILLITINMFSISAEMISREYTTDKETGDAVVIEKYEGEEDGIIERRIQGNKLPIARIIKDIYSPNNKYDYSYTVTYNINLETGVFDKKEFFYNERSIIEYSIGKINNENNQLLVVVTSDFKPNNTEHLNKTIDTFTLTDNKKIKSIFYYNQNKRLEQSYFEYDNNQIVYVKSDYRTHPEGMKTLENYYSYPSYSYESRNPYLQISTYENNLNGIIQEIYRNNVDGTYSHEYIVNPEQRSTLFTRNITVYMKDGKASYSEQYYEKELYRNRAFKVVENWDENGNAESVFYYDKDGNEIPESELDILE